VDLSAAVIRKANLSFHLLCACILSCALLLHSLGSDPFPFSLIVIAALNKACFATVDWPQFC